MVNPRRSATRFIDTAPRPSLSASSIPLWMTRSRLSPSLGFRSSSSRLQSRSSPDGGLSLIRPSRLTASRQRSILDKPCVCRTLLVYMIHKTCEVDKMTSAISVAGLVKRFGARPALDQLDLTVGPARSTASSGPTAPARRRHSASCWDCWTRDGGSASVLGMDPWRDAATLHRRLAYVPGEVSLWPNLTGGEVIDLLGSLRGGLDRTRRDALVERFQLDPAKKCRAYSKGNRQKVALVAAFASARRAVPAGRADVRPRPAHGRRLPGLRARGPRGRQHRPAVEPHPLRGRGPV